jgi:branched-chain amino acid transport system substrate-binding protein
MRRTRRAVVGCDDVVDARRAATHLVDDVGVPAIVGFGSGKAHVDLAASLLVPRRVLSVSTLTNSAFVTQVPQPAGLPRLVWRTSYSVEATAVATAAFVHEALEPRLHRATTRVALLHDPSPSLIPFAQRLYRSLVFNGKTAVENGDAYRELEFADAHADGGDGVERVARAVIDARPSIVILLGDATQPVVAVDSIEARWPPDQPRPTYLLADDSTDTLSGFTRMGAEHRHRVFALASALVPATTSHFVVRFNLAHPGEATDALNPGSSYDAFYLLAYAVFTQGSAEMTGPVIGSGIVRLLPPGKPVETGPADVLVTLASLARGDDVDLGGPSGSLDLDPATGEWQPDFTLTCPVADAVGRPADAESGITYSAKQRRVEGVLRCP